MRAILVDLRAIKECMLHSIPLVPNQIKNILNKYTEEDLDGVYPNLYQSLITARDSAEFLILNSFIKNYESNIFIKEELKDTFKNIYSLLLKKSTDIQPLKEVLAHICEEDD